MATNLKRRIDRLQEQVQPRRYQTIEDIIFRAHCDNIDELSEDARRRIVETKDLPLHPKIAPFFEKLDQEEDSTGGPR